MAKAIVVKRNGKPAGYFTGFWYGKPCISNSVNDDTSYKRKYRVGENVRVTSFGDRVDLERFKMNQDLRALKEFKTYKVKVVDI